MKLRSAFTLIELMVAISILVLIILGVNLVFKGASNAVGTSQGLMEMMANVRSVNELIDSDVRGMDKSCFLVIRCRKEVGSSRRFDQVSFISRGAFANHSGNNNSSAGAVFSESTVASAGYVWWGSLVREQLAPLTIATATYVRSDQTQQVAINQLPTGSNLAATDVESQFTLGRHGMMLLPGPPFAFQPGGQPHPGIIDLTSWIGVSTGNLNPNAPNDSIAAYPSTAVQAVAQGNDLIGQSIVPGPWDAGTALYADGAPMPPGTPIAAIDYFNPWRVVAAGEVSPINGGGAKISSSRVNAAACTSSEIVQAIAFDRAHGADPSFDPVYEAHHFCYRFKALATIYDSELNNLVNGFFRLSPVVLSGVSSFRVEWTDGATDVNGNLLWYGPNYAGINGAYQSGNAGSPLYPDVTTKYTLIGDNMGFAGYKFIGNNISIEHDVNTGYGAVDQAAQVDLKLGDDYVAIFSYDTSRVKWPKALRFSYHVVSPSFPAGRDFVQVTYLPN